MWVGLNDRQAEGTLVWENGESYDESLFENWGTNEPKNEETKDCVVVSSSDFKWRMTDCSSTSHYGYLCMKGGSFGKNIYK